MYKNNTEKLIARLQQDDLQLLRQYGGLYARRSAEIYQSSDLSKNYDGPLLL